MLRAYVMFDTDPVMRDVDERLRAKSLGSCKLLTAALYTDGEIVGHLECADMTVLQTAMLELSTQVEGVRELTLLKVVNNMP